jgi:hypothetical protein
MCRSIRRLRTTQPVPTTGDLNAAALQFVRKVSGMRAPSRAADAAFSAAVAEIAATTARLLADLGSPAIEGPATPPALWPRPASAQRRRPGPGATG